MKWSLVPQSHYLRIPSALKKDKPFLAERYHLSLFFIIVMNTRIKSNTERKEFISSHRMSSIIQRSQGRLEAGIDAEAMNVLLLACLACFFPPGAALSSVGWALPYQEQIKQENTWQAYTQGYPVEPFFSVMIPDNPRFCQVDKSTTMKPPQTTKT